MAGTDIIDTAALDRSLGRLQQDTAGVELPNALQRVIAATRELFAASGSGVMMIDDSTMLCAVAATDDAGFLLETRQQEQGRGPCVDALTLDKVISTSDLGTDERWPGLIPELPNVGVRAILGLPIHVRGLPVGSLNVYRDQPGEWSSSEIDALRAYSTVIEGVLAAALQLRERSELAEQLQHALDHRVVIERAVGAVMGRQRMDPVSAFNWLRDQARSSERRVAEVADELLAQIPASAPGDPGSPQA